jgi:hypothetical protein
MKSRNLLLLSAFLRERVRDVSHLRSTTARQATPLDMTKGAIGAVFLALMFLCEAFAQESPTPSPMPSASPARYVRISFVPPPLEGTISLGIYDSSGKLARVLHQEAELDEFTVGADALVTKWDGKNDDGQDLTAGKYHARGYLVGRLKVENLGKEATPPPADAPTGYVQVKLMPNPLVNNERPTVDLAVGFDDENSFLKTKDDLPLYTISEKPNLVRTVIAKNGEKSVDVWQDDGAVVEQFRVSNIDKMMAFDCGEIELK